MNALQREQPSGIPEFNDVFAQHNRFVWRVLRRLGVQSRDVADVCQEVFLVVHRRLKDFDPARGAVSTWLYGICVRVASAHRRRRPARDEASADLLRSMEPASQPDTDLETQRAWSLLAQVLDEMDEPKRHVFVLYELEALSMNEVAVILECPLQTAYARLHAARRSVLAAFRKEEAP